MNTLETKRRPPFLNIGSTSKQRVFLRIFRENLIECSVSYALTCVCVNPRRIDLCSPVALGFSVSLIFGESLQSVFSAVLWHKNRVATPRRCGLAGAVAGWLAPFTASA